MIGGHLVPPERRGLTRRVGYEQQQGDRTSSSISQHCEVDTNDVDFTELANEAQRGEVIRMTPGLLPLGENSG